MILPVDDRSNPTARPRRGGARWPTILMLALAAAVGWPGSARADIDSRLGLELRSVVSGDELPAIVITPQQALHGLKVKVVREDGDTQQLRSGPVPAGSRKELSIRQPNGKFSYRAEFDADWGGEDTSNFSMAFEMSRTGKLALEIDPKDVDLDARRMTFRMSNPAKRATLTMVGTDGVVMKVVERDLGGAAAGSPLSLTWDALPRDLLHMDLKVTDVTGFWKVVRMTPFAVQIPHDDVVFDTDRWDIKRSEEHKLDKTLALINEALAKHGQLLQLKLFVAGYTDTVSSKQHNQRLSENRARAIAVWFRGKGLRVPIHYQGFGEEVLAVDTPDETPEQRNRRALYLLASQRPPKGRELPRDDWKQL